jgi:molecular chaperone DnaK
VIKASSGLSEDEIKRMVRDAEAHAEEDKKFRELVETRNKADGMVHSVEQTLKDLGEKVATEERVKVENALNDLKAVLKDDDKDKIEKKLEALMQASSAIAQQAYAQQSGEGGDQAGAAGGAEGSGKDRGDVLDAEFEEVKDKDQDRKAS